MSPEDQMNTSGSHGGVCACVCTLMLVGGQELILWGCQPRLERWVTHSAGHNFSSLYAECLSLLPFLLPPTWNVMVALGPSVSSPGFTHDSGSGSPGPQTVLLNPKD